MRRTDGGTYTCTAFNELGNIKGESKSDITVGLGVVSRSIFSQSERGVQARVLHHEGGEGPGTLPLLPGEGLPSQRDVLLVPRRTSDIL